jgi:hypothetical protein
VGSVITGNDSLYGGTGRDQLFGESGATTSRTPEQTAADSTAAAGHDTLEGGAGAKLCLGGTGNDMLTTSHGNDVIAFNAGDGQDLFAMGARGDDLITFVNWCYDAAPSRSIVILQIVAEAMASFNADGTAPLLDQKIESFDFAGLVGAYDAARTDNPLLESWVLTHALLDHHLSGSDTARSAATSPTSTARPVRSRTWAWRRRRKSSAKPASTARRKHSSRLPNYRPARSRDDPQTRATGSFRPGVRPTGWKTLEERHGIFRQARTARPERASGSNPCRQARTVGVLGQFVFIVECSIHITYHKTTKPIVAIPLALAFALVLAFAALMKSIPVKIAHSVPR